MYILYSVVYMYISLVTIKFYFILLDAMPNAQLTQSQIEGRISRYLQDVKQRLPRRESSTTPTQKRHQKFSRGVTEAEVELSE